jgi:hypothetical protein
MKKLTVYLFLLSLTIFFSCKKSSSSNSNAVNTWTFTQGSTVHSGSVPLGAALNTYLQGNNSYSFGVSGVEQNNGHGFDIVLSLADTTFTQKTYQSGVAISDLITSFYYSTAYGSIDIFYESSNYPTDIGAVMNYTITSFNASTNVLEITFSGQAIDSVGNNVNITNGKVTCKVSKL